MKEERLTQILLAPHISEKSAGAAETNNQYVFRVRRDANKGEIKDAVEKMFDVQVDAVRVTNMKGKVKQRFGMPTTRRKIWKKAYVSLKPGSEIDLMGAE